MGKESYITRRIEKDGIEVVVTIREKKFDVSISIGPEADISKKYKCEEFTLKFRAADNGKKLAETVRLEKKKIPYNKSSVVNNAVLTFKNEQYKCQISLSPKFYVPDEELKQFKPKNKKKIKKVSLNYSCKSGIRTFRPIPYVRTNIARPYRGGRCSPK